MSTPTNTSPGNDDNVGTGLDKAKINRQITELGNAEGRGSNSRPGLALVVAEAARHKVLGVDDAEGVWTRFAQASSKSQGIGYVPLSSEAQQVSKLRAVIRMGELVHVDAVEVLNRATVVLGKMRAANEGKPVMPQFDAYVSIARAQVTSQPDAPLTDEQIEAICTPKEKDIPEEADRLEKIMEAMAKAAEAKKDPLSQESVDVLQEGASAIMTRIRELGGSTKMRKAAAKLAAKGQTLQALVDANVRRQAELRQEQGVMH